MENKHDFDKEATCWWALLWNFFHQSHQQSHYVDFYFVFSYDEHTSSIVVQYSNFLTAPPLKSTGLKYERNENSHYCKLSIC